MGSAWSTARRANAVYHLDPTEVHFAMPTTRPRHQVTETPAVEAALNRAQQRWPDLSRGQSLVRLLEVGAESLSTAESRRRDLIMELVATFEEKYATAYPEGYLSDLREDWPA